MGHYSSAQASVLEVTRSAVMAIPLQRHNSWMWRVSREISYGVHTAFLDESEFSSLEFFLWLLLNGSIMPTSMTLFSKPHIHDTVQSPFYCDVYTCVKTLYYHFYNILFIGLAICYKCVF